MGPLGGLLLLLLLLFVPATGRNYSVLSASLERTLLRLCGESSQLLTLKYINFQRVRLAEFGASAQEQAAS